MEFRDIQVRECYEGSENLNDTFINDTEWADSLLNNYFSFDNNTLEQDNAVTSEGDLPWLSPNTMQIFDDFSKELNENPPPTDLMDIVPVRPSIIEEQNKFAWADSHSPDTLEGMLSELGDFTPHTSPIVKQNRGWGLGCDDNIHGGGVMIHNSRRYWNFKKQIRY